MGRLFDAIRFGRAGVLADSLRIDCMAVCDPTPQRFEGRVSFAISAVADVRIHKSVPHLAEQRQQTIWQVFLPRRG